MQTQILSSSVLRGCVMLSIHIIAGSCTDFRLGS